jgi:anaerobic selenocysteine-containing dehydrogenase
MIEGLDRLDPRVRELDMSRIGSILADEPDALRGGPPVGAMLIQNTNPAVVAPETLKVRQGFLRDDLFVAVHEQFMTETATLADIVIPATTFLEHEDIYQGGGHTFLQVACKVIEPFAGARSNHWVLQQLARRLHAEHPGFSMSAWELIDWTLRTSGLPDAETLARQRWIDCALPFERAHFLDGFATPDKRFHFRPDWERLGPAFLGMPAFPDHFDVIDKATADRPFRLVTPPARQFLNTTFTETPTSRAREGRPTALIHPADCAALDLSEGSRVRIGNERGSVVVHTRPFDGLQPGVLVVEGIWPNASFPEGVGINSLTSAEPGRPAGGAVFHDTAVWLKPV